MSSKKKPNGCTSVRCIRLAMKRLNVNLRQLFTQAAHAAHSDADIDHDLQRFEMFCDKGSEGVGKHYAIPAYLLDFASSVRPKKPTPIPARKPPRGRQCRQTHQPA